MINIIELTAAKIGDLHRANQPFEIIGRLNLTFNNGRWEHSEDLTCATAEKQYPNYDGATPSDYIGSQDRIAYLAYDDDRCAGQLLLAKTWNGYAHIEDISVAKTHRGQGVGTALLAKACEWAKANNLAALSVECQDNNLLASRFFIKHGFEIGGVNTQLYAMLGKPYSTETAVFWYKKL